MIGVQLYKIDSLNACTMASKISVTPKSAYLPISKLHSILAVANLLAHNNKSQICYCGQISLQSAAVNCSLSDTFGGNIYFAGDGTYTGYTRDYITKEFNKLNKYVHIYSSRGTYIYIFIHIKIILASSMQKS